MKRTLTALALLLASGSTFAAQMECMVDTAAYDEWSAVDCPNFEYTLDKAPNDAFWRIVNVTKTISTVIWQDATSGCDASSTQCSKAIRPYRNYVGKATILYTDGTYEVVQASASFETGY